MLYKELIKEASVIKQSRHLLHLHYVVLFQGNLSWAVNGKSNYKSENRKGLSVKKERSVCWSDYFQREELSLSCSSSPLTTDWVTIIIPQTCDSKQRWNGFTLNSSQFHIITEQWDNKCVLFCFRKREKKKITTNGWDNWIFVFGCKGCDPVRESLHT